MNIHTIQQLDYIRILLEEDRHGEALNHMRSLMSKIEKMCEYSVSRLSENVTIGRTTAMTKPQNWMYVNGTWAKLIGIDVATGELSLEVADGMPVKTRFTIDVNSAE